MLTRCKKFITLTSLSCCLSQICLGSNNLVVDKIVENKEILLGECIKSLEEICDNNLSVRQYLESEDFKKIDKTDKKRGIYNYAMRLIRLALFAETRQIKLNENIHSLATISEFHLDVPYSQNLDLIFQSLLIINGCLKNLSFRQDRRLRMETANEVLSEKYKGEILNYQGRMNLKNTGVIDRDTLLSMLISCGDKRKSNIACDTCLKLNMEHINALKNKGISYVGRYLTNTEKTTTGLPPRDKALTAEELENLSKEGMYVWLIFQEGVGDISRFKKKLVDRPGIEAIEGAYNIGMDDAKVAEKAAKNLEISSGEYIYFAVDFDATDEQIKDVIIPYFQGIIDGLNGYKVGIYGSRMACSKVCEHFGDQKILCFLADSSYAYTGNIGVEIPKNWVFQQYSTDLLVHVDGEAFEIDANHVNVQLLNELRS